MPAFHSFTATKLCKAAGPCRVGLAWRAECCGFQQVEGCGLPFEGTLLVVKNWSQPSLDDAFEVPDSWQSAADWGRLGMTSQDFPGYVNRARGLVVGCFEQNSPLPEVF